MAGDSALRSGVTRDALDAALQRASHWVGATAARRAVAFLDERSEGAGESLSRVRCHQAGLPAPVPQFEVRDGTRFVARVDFGWPELKTIGEFDGRITYGALLRPGEQLADVILREKRREETLRELGWRVVRWIWSSLFRFDEVADRLRRTFALSL